MLTSVVENVFFVYKACTVNHNYTEEICLHIQNYTDIKKEVQVSFSELTSLKHIQTFLILDYHLEFLSMECDRWSYHSNSFGLLSGILVRSPRKKVAFANGTAWEIHLFFNDHSKHFKS